MFLLLYIVIFALHGGERGSATRQFPILLVFGIMASVRIEKPRLFQSTKDIVMTIGVLLVVTFFTVGFTGLCSFNPGGPDKSGPVQEVDVHTVLELDARGLSIPIRDPKMPEDWQANSARRTQMGREPSSLVGWVVGGDRYISLTQTAADLKAAQQPDDKLREQTGKQKAGGLTWLVLEGEDARSLWVADAGDVRLILTGMAGNKDMKTAAEIVGKTKPLDVKSEKSATESEAPTGTSKTPTSKTATPVA